MALTITIIPKVPTIFNRMKESLDRGIYMQREAGFPMLDEITISGTGGHSEEDMNVYVNGYLKGSLQTTQEGTFGFTFEPLKKENNYINAVGSVSGRSNYLAVDMYHYLSYLYIMSKRMQEVLQNFAQTKQNYYIQSKVGDLLESRLLTDKDTYKTSDYTLYDKFPQNSIIPYDDIKGDMENITQSGIDLSWQGSTVESLLLIQEIMQEVLNDSNVAIWAWCEDNFFPWVLETGYIHAILNPITGNYDTITIPRIIKKYKYQRNWIRYSAPKEMVITHTDGYIWFYIDGDLETDGTYEIKTSLVQPVPQYLAVTEAFLGTDFETDTDGSITGVKGEKYIVLNHAAISRYPLSVTFSGSTIGNPRWISPKIVALGLASEYTNIVVNYTRYYEPIIICVVYMVGGIVDEICRTFDEPNHIWITSKFWKYSYEIYCRTSHIMNSEQINILKELIDSCITVNKPRELFVNSITNDQTYVVEDGPYWRGFYKNYSFVE